MPIEELNIPYSKLTVIDKIKKRMKIYIRIFRLKKIYSFWSSFVSEFLSFILSNFVS